jgi:hypothetical protein
MKITRKNHPLIATSVLACALALGTGGANATGLFGPESLNGDFVVAADGGFVAQTPFAPSPLRLNIALVGRLTLDGNGGAGGEYTISFHHEAVPFGVRSHFKAVGSYEIAPNGHMFIELQEFKVEPPPDDDGVADGIVRFECYVVRRQAEARCVVNSLISLQQGPDPVPEPVTMSGSLLRQD